MTSHKLKPSETATHQPATQTTSKLSKQNTTTRITILTLPRELRQKILIETLHSRLDFIAGFTPRMDVLTVRTIREAFSEWTKKMKNINSEVGLDAEYVASKMRQKYAALEDWRVVNVITGYIWGPKSSRTWMGLVYRI